MMVLTVGVMVVALALVLVVTAATAVHLERKRLLAATDLAALDAADAMATPLYFAPGAAEPGKPMVPLTDSSVRAAVERWFADHPDPHLQHVEVVDASTPDGRTVQVTVRAVVRPGLPGDGLLGDLPVDVEVQARSTARAS